MHLLLSRRCSGVATEPEDIVDGLVAYAPDKYG